jgi:hypothetical protein
LFKFKKIFYSGILKRRKLKVSRNEIGKKEVLDIIIVKQETIEIKAINCNKKVISKETWKDFC